ncbi:MAG: carboxypeptidase regulatory-like domain-containing protein [Kofleriaceae bacterium]|nr:carboxypeptidase regulatory-like domain-containing protein [Kofleriaceae bacterium]
MRGTVSDATGGTIDGALIVLAPEEGILRADGRRAVAAVTGADGAFAVGVVPGRYRLTASHPEYVDDVRSLEIGPGGATVDVALVPGGVVEGTVRDRASGAPVAGARVGYSREVVRAGPMGGAAAEARGRGEVVAGADGGFRIAGLGAGRIVLTATTDDDRASDEPAEVLLGVAETATGVDVFVGPALSIAGRVVDDAGAPVPGAEVSLEARGEARMIEADAAGAFVARGLQPGRFALVASSDDALPGEPASVELVDRPVDAVTLTVRRGAFVTGRVDPAGPAEVFVRPPDDDDAPSPLGAGMFRLAMGGPRARTAPDGTFRLGPFEPGKVELGARAADGRRGELDVDVAATGKDGVVIPLEARGRIAGRVVSRAGAPVPGAVVSLKRAAGSSRTLVVNGVDMDADRAPCDDDGYFAIAGLDAGTWELRVLDARGGAVAFDRGKGGDADAPERVELAGGQAKDGVTLTVAVNDGVIRGVVVGPDGQPVADAWVTVEAAGLGIPGLPGGRLPGPGGGAAGGGPGPGGPGGPAALAAPTTPTTTAPAAAVQAASRAG